MPDRAVARARRRWTGTVVVLLLLAPFAGSATFAAPAPAATAPAACATSDLVIWLNTMGNGAAGSIYYTVEFTNLSGHSCTLLGYPGVSAVNLGGGQIGAAAARNPVSTPALVTLRRGATATAILQITEAGNFPTARCHETTAAGLRVYPPNQRSSSLIPFPFSACGASGVADLHVEPVRKG